MKWKFLLCWLLPAMALAQEPVTTQSVTLLEHVSDTEVRVRIDETTTVSEEKVVSLQGWEDITAGAVDPIEDPRQLVKHWKDRAKRNAVAVMARQPIEAFDPTATNDPIMYRTMQYEGPAVFWQLAKIFEDEDPETAAEFFNYGLEMVVKVLPHYPRGGIMLRGPTEPTKGWLAYGPAGHLIYPLSPLVYSREANIASVLPHTFPNGETVTTVTELQAVLQRHAANYARFCGGMVDPANILGNIVSKNDYTYPSETALGLNGTNYDPVSLGRVRYSVRPWALTTIAHMVTDPFYHVHEERQRTGQYGTMTYVQAHDMLVDQYMWRVVLAPGAAVDILRKAGKELDEAGGDFTQVQTWWEGHGSDLNTFMWAGHLCRALVFYCTDTNPAYQYRDEARQAVIDICDIYMKHHRTTTTDGYPALIYGVRKDGTVNWQGAPDLSNFVAPSYAWAFKQTGERKYYDVASDLIHGANHSNRASWGGGKQFNQLAMPQWIWLAFGWMKLTDDQWRAWWRE